MEAQCKRPCGLQSVLVSTFATECCRSSRIFMAVEAPTESSDFPGPLSATEQMARAATFWTRVFPVLTSYLQVYFAIQFRERLLGQCLDEEECELTWSAQHERGADVVAKVIQDLKGFYVKTGQIIASREDLFPKQYTERLAGLTDLLDPMPVSLVKAVISQARNARMEVIHSKGVRGRSRAWRSVATLADCFLPLSAAPRPASKTLRLSGARRLLSLISLHSVYKTCTSSLRP
eukprot:6182408-Pleurochrysis_carterae.AAC.2